MQPVTDNDAYVQWWYQNGIEEVRDFMDIMDEYMKAWTSLDKLKAEAQQRGNIRNEELYPALMRQNIAAKRLHDYMVARARKSE